MFVHPKTGKNIRVLNTDASRWKDQKTLAFSATVTPWDSVWTTHLQDGSAPTFRILLGKHSVSALKDATKSRYIFTDTPDSVTKRLGFIPLEDLHLSFPQLGDEWDGTAEDAAAMIAHLFHYQRFYTGEFTNQRLRIPIHRTAPEPLWLITQTYKPQSAARAKEIDGCLQRNLENHLISGILLLNESPCAPTNSPTYQTTKPNQTKPNQTKLKEEIIGHRITYADVFKAIESLPENALVVFANADICLDPVSWRSLWDVNLQDVCIALLRYDVPSSGCLEDATLFGPRADSQDTWVVRAADIKSRTLTQFDIPFGTMGCDNAFALEMLRQKFCVINPCHTLITWHFHSSGIRTYDKDDVIDRPMFHYIHPSGLHDMKPCLDIKPYIHHAYDPVTLNRQIKGRGAATWIHAMGKKGFSWKLDSTNPLIIKEKVLRLQNVYQTVQGLAYDSKTMYVGDGKDAQTVWAASPIRPLLSTLRSDQGFIIPWPKGAEKSRELYTLRYLSKVLRLRELCHGDFFCPESMQNLIKLFRWGSPLPLIKYEPDIQIWHGDAYVFPVEDDMISPNDIQALRKAVPWTEKVDVCRRIVLAGEFPGVEEVLEKTGEVFVVYPGKTSPERMLACLSGAWAIVCPSGFEASAWNWMLPKGAYVFEVDSNDDASLNISAAANLEHRFVSADTILDEIFDDDSPVVWVPVADGFFSHPGDGARELIDMWASKRYIQKKEHPTAKLCWWGEVGSVLLYDRFTQACRLAAPSAEREYTTALFSDDWFWSRNPKIVEEFIEQGFHTTPWEKRTGYAVISGVQDTLVSLSNSLYVKDAPQDVIIEALAMGCIPVCEVPFLKEGEHYIRAEASLSREEWERISANGHRWWKENCSCDGSFQLVQKLATK